MANKKISELTATTAVSTMVIPASNSAGTATSKVTLQSVLDLETRWACLLPLPPASVTANPGNLQAVLTWTATATTAPPVTDYNLTYSSDGSTWLPFTRSASTATTATVTGLTNETAYTIKVASVNGVGVGAPTAGSTVTPSSAIYHAIPAMTGMSSPSGLVTVSSEYAQQWTPNILWKLFSGGTPAGDGSENIRMSRYAGNSPPRRIQYDFAGGVKSKINGYTIQHGITDYPNSGAAADRWTFEGSNDGSTWTVLDSRTGESTSGAWNAVGQIRSFSLASTANYSSYRWYFADAGGNDFFWARLSVTQ